ncbi:MAG: hypothetical protein N4435_05920 [Candidatus Ornithobacterium hominis]|uniref:hypothetical protein n=1 Tax=Candidatus Ornithobacterium hominis TaxID=2497989 RepID=UPI000E5B1A60|nr:hypothetical protein [Candidatus Ornithobacterium hominis]MCT7904724.1 hypothetical protein [Candidatus Ornithobacterium hominis]
MEDRQVKSKKRVADHGEVFTNEREVKAMVDLVWKNLDKALRTKSSRLHSYKTYYKEVKKNKRPTITFILLK